MLNAHGPCCESLESRLLMDFTGPDLVAIVNDGVIPMTIVPGETITVPVNILNQGDQIAKSKSGNSKVYMRIYLSLDDKLNRDVDILLGQYSNLINLPAHASGTVNVKVAIPCNLAAGSYQLISQLDATDLLTQDESDSNNNIVAKNNDGTPRLRTVAWEFGGVEGRTNVPLTLIGNDGKLILLKLTGPGMGVVTPSASSPAGKISYDVTITNSTTATSAVITTGAGSGVVLGNVAVQGSIKSISASQLALVGDLSITGSCTTLSLGDVGNPIANDLSINIGAGKGLTASFGTVGNVQFTSASPVKAFTATNWIDSHGTLASQALNLANDNADTFTAPSLAKMTIGRKVSSTPGDFQANVVITGDASKVDLGTVSILGGMTGDWTVNGSLKAMTVVGAVSGSTVRTTGSMTSLVLGACLNSNFLAGIAGNVAAKPTHAADFISAATIGSFTVKGYKTADNTAQFFVNSNLSADHLGKVALTSLDTNNGGTTFGLHIKTTVTQVSGTDGDFSWIWKPKHSLNFPNYMTQDFDVTVFNT